MGTRILLALTDLDLADRLAAALASPDVAVEREVPAVALEAIERGAPDAVVVELDSERRRWALLEGIRAVPAWSGVAVAAISGRKDPIDDVVRAFKGGLDDYVSRPVEPAVLAARLLALVALRKRLAPAQKALATKDGQLALDPAGRRCWTGAGGRRKELALTNKEFDVLAFLLARRNKLVHRDELVSALWRGTAIEENSRTLVQHVLHLRTKLGSLGRRLETVRGLGYRFADE